MGARPTRTSCTVQRVCPVACSRNSNRRSRSRSCRSREAPAAPKLCKQIERRKHLLQKCTADNPPGATAESVRAITSRAKKLSPHAIKIVAGVTGAPSIEEFMHALDLMTPESLTKLRSDLNEMGINN